MKSIFVSSTFKDMQAERDLLTVIAVPELNEYARSYGQAVRLVDLRWGVNTGDLESEEGSKKVLSVCLDEIDGSRPYMIVLVGDRYGWIPEEKLIRSAAEQKNYLLTDYEKSVTELEIEYGAISNPEQLKRCLFYFREPLPYDKMSQEDRSVYLTEDDRGKSKLARLKETIVSSGAVVKEYSLAWNEAQHRVEGVERFVNMVVADIKALLGDEFDKNRLQSWQEQEAVEAKILAENKRSQFSSRYDLLEKYMKQVRAEKTRLFLLRGASGSGKSTMLSKLEYELAKEAETLFIACGNGRRSQSADDLLQQIVFYLKTRLGRTEHFGDEEKSGDIFKQAEKKTLRDWSARFTELAYEYSSKSEKPLYIICDALDQLMRDETVMKFLWLPEALPEAITLVFSCLDGFELPSVLPYWEHSIVETLPELSQDEISSVIDGILSFAHKELDKTIKTAVESKSNAVNPLYLDMLIQRLIMLDSDDFGIISRYGDNMEAINRYLLETISSCPDTLPEMCRAVFEEAAERINLPFCRKASCLIAVSRRGLRETDLAGIFAAEGLEWNSLDFSRFFKYLRPYFVTRGDGRIDFIHRAIRDGLVGNTDTAHDNIMIFEQFRTLEYEDTVRLGEIAYHAQKADSKKFLTEYVETAVIKSDTVKKVVAEALHENAMTNPRWFDDFLSAASDNGAGSDFVSFFNYDFYYDFKRSMDEQQLLLSFMDKVSLTAEKLAEDLKTSAAYQMLSICYERIGDIYSFKHKFYETLEQYKKSFILFERLADELKTAESYMYLAGSYTRIGSIYALQCEFTVALEMCEKGLEISERLATELNTTKSYRDLAESYKYIGGVYFFSDKYRTALKMYKKKREILECLAEELKTPEAYCDLAESYNQLGRIFYCWRKSKLTDALKMFKKELEILERLPEKTRTPEMYNDLAESYCYIGSIYEIHSKHNQALEWYKKAHEIFRRLAEEQKTPEAYSDLAVSYSNIGNIFIALGKHDDALEMYKKELKIREWLAEELKTPDAYNNLARSYWENAGLTDADSSRRFLEEALHTWKQLAAVVPDNPEYRRICDICREYINKLN